MEDIKSGKIRRAHFRYRPDELTSFAAIDARNDVEPENFQHQLSGLITSESYGGCAIIVRQTNKLQVGDHCCIQIALLNAIRAEVVWRREIDRDVIKCGFKFLE